MTLGVEQFLNARALLKVDNRGLAPERDLQVSTAVLLMYMAKSEGTFGAAEVSAVLESLARQFEIKSEEAGELVEIAEFLLAEKQRISDFVKIVNDRFEKSQKITLMAMLWKVMLADGLVTRLEAEFGADLCGMLEIGAAEVSAAQDLVERGEV